MWVCAGSMAQQLHAWGQRVHISGVGTYAFVCDDAKLIFMKRTRLQIVFRLAVYPKGNMKAIAAMGCNHVGWRVCLRGFDTHVSFLCCVLFAKSETQRYIPEPTWPQT
jgi:hypothetical protein